MATETEIANLALQLVGTRSTITSLAENSNEAINANLLFVPVRDDLLEEADWNFAEKVATLTRLKALPGTPEGAASTATAWSTSFPPPPWNYEYQLPTDLIKARFVVPQSGWQQLYRAQTLGLKPTWESVAVPFKIVTDTVAASPANVLVTNAPEALLVYTWKNTTTTLWSNKFVNAFAARLAYRLAMPLSGDKQIALTNYQLSNSLVAEARAEDANEGLTVIDPPVDWLEARGWPDGTWRGHPWLV